jgi:hypothetical protein
MKLLKLIRYLAIGLIGAAILAIPLVASAETYSEIELHPLEQVEPTCQLG